MAKYKIRSRGASHTRKEDGKFRRYGLNDVIELEEKSVKAGLYDHLKLEKVSGDVATTSSSPGAAKQTDTKKSDDEARKAADQKEARTAQANALIAKAEQASTAKDISAVGEEAKKSGLLENPPAKKSELIEELSKIAQE